MALINSGWQDSNLRNLLVPGQTLYQAELHPVITLYSVTWTWWVTIPLPFGCKPNALSIELQALYKMEMREVESLIFSLPEKCVPINTSSPK